MSEKTQANPQLKDVGPKKPRIMGPALIPIQVIEKTQVESEEETNNAKRKIVPSREDVSKTSVVSQPPIETKEDFVGPMLPRSAPVWTNERKKEISEQFKEKEKEEWKKLRDENTAGKSREEWMTSLPEGKTQLVSLGPRKFSKSGQVPTLDESWTESPDGEKPAKKKKSDREILNEEYESAIQQQQKHQFDQLQQQRGPSLVEIHQHKIKTKKNETTERRPFNRDEDVVSRRVDPTKRSILIEKSKELHQNFEPGKFI